MARRYSFRFELIWGFTGWREHARRARPFSPV